MPESDAPRDFHARLTRRLRARAIGARRTRHGGRRLAVLAIAVAAPAFAAPGGWNENEPFTRAEATVPATETPADGGPASAAFQPVALPGAAPAARVLGGSARDRMRARQCLTMAIYYEAAEESEAGQRAVAQVVLNRVAHPEYPATVCGVVFQGSDRATGCQFTFTCDGSLARRPAQAWWNRASRIAAMALAGGHYAPAGRATHYHTLAVDPYWADSLDEVGTIGAHRFYRWRGAAGRPEAFRIAYAGGEPAAAPLPRRSVAVAPAPPAPAIGAAADISRPTAPVTVPTTVPDTAAVSLPAKSMVRPEYAHSGQWIVRP